MSFLTRIFCGGDTCVALGARVTGKGNTSVAPTLLSLVLLLVCVSCEEHSDKPANVTTQPSGASEESYVTEKSKVQQIVAVTPAPKPTKTLPGNATCVSSECHANLATARQIHGPVSEKACTACHEEDIGGHKFPLKRKGNATCTFCHSVAGTESHQHKAIEQGCIACHQPHVSKQKFLLKTDTIEQLCQSCHNVPLKQHAHAPFAKGDCTACHLPHQSNTTKLLRGGEGAEHCFMCHSDMRAKLQTASMKHKPAVTDCTRCHSAHSTENDHQLVQVQEKLCYSCHKGMKTVVQQAAVKHAAMDTTNKCSTCHDPHASKEPRLLKARADSVCLSCHTKMKPLLTESKYLHGPNRVGNCAACHSPHGAPNPNLLTKAFPKTFYTSFDVTKYELCFTCHEQQLVLTAKTTSLTNFRDGDNNLHYLHVNRDPKGRTCKACHNVHASNLPNHLASEVPFEGSKWAMPMDYQPTQDGGSCSPGCHTTKTYSRSKPLPSSPLTGQRAGETGLNSSSAKKAPTTRGVS